ncbi:MAG: DNA polymerase III subunit alpha [Alphaproteobacteria bacterium]|nr:DNA polymerase III subunit alpha [Alphaproteobacteria bacterium]
MTAPFIHLHTHSAYSLAEGAIQIKDLIKLCLKNKMPALAVTDTNNLFGALEFAMEARKAGVQPIIGVQVTLHHEGAQGPLVLLAQNEAGYRNLCALISTAYVDKPSDAEVHVTLATCAAHSEGIIALSGGPRSVLNALLLHGQDETAETFLKALSDIYGDRLYIELQRHDWPQEEAVEARLINLAYAHNIPLVATNDCYFAKQEGYEAHDALLCIAQGRYITEEDRRRVTPEHSFKSGDEMADLFADVPEAVANTALIARRCAFLLEPSEPMLPAFPTEQGRSEAEELQAQAEAGLEWRLSKIAVSHEIYKERLAFELSVINTMGYAGYFLIVSDFILWAKAQNIPVGPGRGSGAGSVVAWALQITDLDPIAFNLLFERFLNPERVSMPDFDIDFCQERRDEVIHYVQEKYGRDRVAQIITFGKLQARAVVRDVGRVLQIPYGQVDRIAKMIPNNPANPITLGEALKQDAALYAEYEKDDTQRKLIDIALQLEGLYRHASTHAAGVVIGDRPLQELIPLYRDPRSTMLVTGFNMKYAEMAGLVKFDFLGLKNMTVIQRAVEMVNSRESGVGSSEDSKNLATRHAQLTTLSIPLDDAKTYALLTSGNTVGVFQLESAGMRDALRRMKPNRFDDIIALVALYRPGPMDNIPRYVAVKEGREEPDYMHPKLEPILKDTYSIMIYQEQVMQAAQILAGYSLGQADLLRRAMGKKIKAEMDAQREAFIEGAMKHSDVPRAQAEYIFDQIDKFAGYGFNKSHAAAYALIAYWTAWLKANHPLEFMAASMTLDKGDTDKLAVFKQDLDKMGIRLLPPDINASTYDFAVEGDAIRYALSALKGVGEQAMRSLVEERAQSGPFKNLDDFAMRLDPRQISKRQFEPLAAAGAFDALHANRAQLFESGEIILRHAHNLQDERASGQVSLFGEEGGGNTLGLPTLPARTDWDPLEKLAKEFDAVGFYLSAHPLDSRQGQFKSQGIVAYNDIPADLQAKGGAARYAMAGVVLKRQEKISQRGNRFAFVHLSDPSGVYEVTLFSEQLQAARGYLEPGQAVLLTVEAERREDQIRLTAQRVEPLDAALDYKVRRIEITVESAEALSKIKQFLDVEGRGHARIALLVPLAAGQEAVLELPGQWGLSTQARNIIRGQQGVRSVAEF